MSQRKKKEDKDSDPGVGTVFATGAAVVGVAALAFGAWKLYDFFANNSEEGASAAPSTANKSAKPPKKVCDSSDDDDDHDGSNIPVPSRRNDNLPERNNSTAARPSFAPAKPEMSLSAQLLDYYQKYVDMNPIDFREAVKLVKDLKMQIVHCMQRNEKLKALGVSQPVDMGSSTDGLMVICPENFDILIPFALSPDDCIINRADATSEFHSIGFEHDDNAWADACNSRKCLDSEKLVNLLSDVLEKAVCSGTSVVTSAKKLRMEEAAAVVEVCYASGLKKVTINIIPAVVIGDRRFVPEHVPDLTHGEEREGFCWRESFGRKEQQSLNRFGTSVSSHRIILKIFKAIRLNFPLQFGLLSSYHYKTVLLRVLDDQVDAADWETSAISERFIDYLIELGNCLKERSLPHYFRPECNLLGQISPQSSQNLGHFINRIVGHHDIASLLKYDYGYQ